MSFLTGKPQNQRWRADSMWGRSSSTVNGLVRKSFAPAAAASERPVCLDVTMMIGTSEFFRIARQTPSPFIPGMSQSSRIKSGESVRMSFRASSPLPASRVSYPFTSKPSRKARRNWAWSSTIKITGTYTPLAPQLTNTVASQSCVSCDASSEYARPG